MSEQLKDIAAFPLQWPSGWPVCRSRKRSNFLRDLSFGRARDELLHELKLMGVSNNFVNTNVVLSSNVPLRQDGLPYSGQANPKEPGVAVYFKYKGKNMVFACDTYVSVADNLWAIRKTVEALRGIERWGASDMMERAFTGFQALPAPSDWRRILQVPPDCRDLLAVKSQYKKLAMRHHPDTGGSPDEMARVNKAWAEAEKELS